jgi:tRNA 2-selenouridine synthase
MIREINIEEFFAMGVPLIDVRSPAEYKKGHIPGAQNIPLFSDEERAQIGTVYIKESKEKAIELGYQFVQPKLHDFIVQSKVVSPQGKAIVHCWRGGMRSHLFAQHLNDNEFNEVSVIIGGYKAYRKYALQTFEHKFDLKIVGGYTGSGKTQIIRKLQESGLQVIDLEGLAKHKGSAFGALAHEDQPTTEQFENNLFDLWRNLDFTEPIWLEDESINIGGVNIPANLFNQMRKSPVYFVDIPQDVRARYLVKEYADLSKEFLSESIRKISKRIGGLETKNALQFIQEEKYYDLALLTLKYYDKSYLKGLNFHDSEKIFKILFAKIDPSANADSIIKLYERQIQCQADTI